MRAAVFCLLLWSGIAGAAELRNVEVGRADGRYFLTSEVWFDTDIESIYAVFLDYDYAAKFSSFIVESRNLEADDEGRPGFYIRNHGCVWFYCRGFERRGTIEYEPLKFIRSTADPESSDFHASLESWRFEEDGRGTLVAYDFEFVPKFWIPPLIGPYVLQRKLKRDSVDAINRIEALAQEWQP